MVDQNLAKGGQRATWSEGLIRVFKLFALLFLYAIVRGGVATRWPLAKGRFSQSLIHLARDLQRFSQIRIRQLIFENHDHLALDDRWALSAKRLDLQERWATIREISSGRMRDLELGRLLGYVEALYSVVIGPYAQLVPPGALEELARDTNALTLVPIPEDTRDGPWGQIFDQQGKDE
jgi:hypothetical protein